MRGAEAAGEVFEDFEGAGEGVGGVEVVAIDVGVDVAGGAGETLVEGVGLAVVLFADPIGEMLLVFFDDVDAAVGAATVDEDVFEVGVALAEDGVDGLLEVLRLLIAGGDDGEARSHSQPFLGARSAQTQASPGVMG